MVGRVSETEIMNRCMKKVMSCTPNRIDGITAKCKRELAKWANTNNRGRMEMIELFQKAYSAAILGWKPLTYMRGDNCHVGWLLAYCPADHGYARPWMVRLSLEENSIKHYFEFYDEAVKFICNQGVSSEDISNAKKCWPLLARLDSRFK